MAAGNAAQRAIEGQGIGRPADKRASHALPRFTFGNRSGGGLFQRDGYRPAAFWVIDAAMRYAKAIRSNGSSQTLSWR